MKIIVYEITCTVLFRLLVAVFSAGGCWVPGICEKILGGGGKGELGQGHTRANSA